MKAKLGWLKTLLLASVLCVVPFAQADQVQMWLTSAGTVTGGGVYVGPYTSNFGPVVCADFSINTYLGESKQWTANVSQSGVDISNTRQAVLVGVDAAQQLYNQAAYLVEKLMEAYSSNVSNKADLQRQLSFAIWEIFTPNVILKLSSTDQIAANTFLSQARLKKEEVNTRLVIYTPDGLTSQNASTLQPQEFFAIRTPEGSVTLLWGINMLGAIGLIVLFRRRTVSI